MESGDGGPPEGLSGGAGVEMGAGGQLEDLGWCVGRMGWEGRCADRPLQWADALGETTIDLEPFSLPPPLPGS